MIMCSTIPVGVTMNTPNFHFVLTKQANLSKRLIFLHFNNNERITNKIQS